MRYDKWLAVLMTGAYLILVPVVVGAGGHLSNNQRTGSSPETLQTPLSLLWVYQSKHLPRQAWPEPKWEVQRIDFDYVYQTASDGKRAYFGSSADHKVYALDVSDGHLCWEFFTEGPVRLTPEVANGNVFVTSDDGFIYCLDGETGNLVWKFRGGPRNEKLMGNEQMVSRWPGRSGALIEDGKVYTTFGMWSRDGVYAYCLDATDGSIIWKNATANFHYTRVPHGEGMAGLSPQGHLVLYKDTLIVATGRAEPIMLHAKTGELVYHKSLGMSHGGAWLMASHDRIFFPCGNRASKPPDVEVADRFGVDRFYDDMCVFSLSIPEGEKGALLCPAYKAIVSGDEMFLATSRGPGVSISRRSTPDEGHSIVAVDMKDVIAGPFIPEDSPSHQKKKLIDDFLFTIVKWSTPCDHVFAMRRAGDTIFVGTKDAILALNANNGEMLWQAKVEGDPRDLNIAGGKLFVSTTKGRIYCFGLEAPQEGAVVLTPKSSPIRSGAMKDKAAKILSDTGIKEGYCLLLGAGDGSLAAELAMQSELTIMCVEPDAKKATKARKALDAAGLYSVRITVHEGGPNTVPYTDYFANLIVADETLADGLKKWSASEIYRVLRPCGGTLYAPGAEPWLKTCGAPAGELHTPCIVRGNLPGAGDWTHQYATAGRTSASRDTIVKLPLKMLWWGKPGPAEMVARHWRAPAPIYSDGRLFTQGENVIFAQDAYNGRILWKRNLPGVAHFPHAYRGGNICTDGKFVYALQGLECLQMDAATGETVRTFHVPLDKDTIERLEKNLTPIGNIGALPAEWKLRQLGGAIAENQKKKPRPTYQYPGSITKGYHEATRYDIPVPLPVEWDYLAVSGNTLLGTIAAPNLTVGWWRRAFPEGKVLFAFDTKNGSLLWMYHAKESISPNAISVNENRVYLIDRMGLAETTRQERAGEKPEAKSFLIALDLRTGEEIWQNEKIAGNMASTWLRDDILLLSLLPPSGALGAIKRTNPRHCMDQPAMQAYSAKDGKMIWEKPEMMWINSPVITSDTIYTKQGFFDLRTGEMLNRSNPLTGEPELWTFNGVKTLCAVNSGAENIILHRALSLAAQDMKLDDGLHYYPNVRPGCWLNTIAAGGMVLCPESSSSCQCSFNYKTSVAMIPAKRHESWGTYLNMPALKNKNTEEEAEPLRVKHMRLNVGAPGDKRDGEDRLWLALPRQRDKEFGGPRSKPNIFDVPVQREFLTDLDFYRLNADETPIAGTDSPWLYTSCLRGEGKLVTSLYPAEDEPKKYRLVLHFAELEGKAVGERIFNVNVNGKELLSNVDIVQKANGANKAVSLEFNQIEPDKGTLTLELVKVKGEPILCAFEMVRE